jgi:ATP-dependent helicase/nuclease subunit B
MIRLILGQAGTGKTARLLQEMADQVKNHGSGFVFLVPEQYSHEAERELCRAAGDGLSQQGEVLSFTGLARKVFSQVGGARPVMDGGGRLLCMAVAMEAVAGSLKVYDRSRRDARMLDSLLKAVEEMKNAGLTSEVLLQTGVSLPGALGDKLHDLGLLLEAYGAAQGRSGVDSADVLERLAQVVGQSDVCRRRFYVDGFSDFTALEKKVLRELMRQGTDMTLCLTCGREEGQEVFSLWESTRRWVRQTAAEYDLPLDEQWMEPAAEGQKAVTFYGRHLFDFTPQDIPVDDGSVVLVQAQEVYEECELAASRMAELARQGARWRDMAVAVRGFGDYRTALESACARYGVPLFLSGRGDTMRKSVPLLIGSALEAVNRGYEYEAVFGYLKTGLSPLSLSETDRLENYALLWQVHGSGWTRPFTMHPAGYNQVWDEKSRQQLEKLNHLRQRTIDPLQQLERAGKRAATAAEQAQALADFLVAIALPERLERRAQELEAASRGETAAEYARLWDIVCTALEQFGAVLGDMPMDGEQFQGMFGQMLSKYDVGIIPVSLDRVQAGDMDGMRRRHIRHLFVLGATDGRLPAPEEGRGLFTPEEREELTGLGFAMGSAEEDFSRELGRIYSCLTLPSESLYISYPASDEQGGQARPSLVVERARALLGLAVQSGDIRRARTFSPEAAFALGVEGASGNCDPQCQAARDYWQNQGRGEELTRLVQSAAAGRGQLSDQGVRTLYGPSPSLSATRAERFGDCHFAYFLQYGLRAKPRQTAVFDPRDYGTFMHYVLEKVAGRALEMGGFAAVSAQQIGQMTDQYMDEYIRDEMGDFADKSARFAYLFRRLRSTVRHVTEDMWQELRQSQFQPLDLELDLTAPGVLEPGQEDVSLTGRADRVDGWVKDDVLYLRITDYKTGIKKFSLSDVCQGMNLQMLLYLFTLEKRGKNYFGVEQIQPAGVLYSPARFEVVQADHEVSDEELSALRAQRSKRSGLVLDEPEVLEAMEPGPEKRFLPVKLTKSGEIHKSSLSSLATLEQFGALSRYIDKTLSQLKQELCRGCVDADPWYKSAQDNACVHCDYQKACLFDENRDSWRLRPSLSAEEAWQTIEKEDDHE